MEKYSIVDGRRSPSEMWRPRRGPVSCGNGFFLLLIVFGLIASPAQSQTSDPPVIVTQPAAITTRQGSNAQFTVSVTGTAPLAFQWYFQSNVLADATNSTLLLTNVQPTHAGEYFSLITNDFGAATSSPAMLTVTVPPAITAQPSSLVTTQGAFIEFAASATGDAPLSYQWFLNGTALPDANNPVYSIASALTNHAGNYQLRVTNPYGEAWSALATLQVLEQDFGDAPAPYATLFAADGARHLIVPGVHMGLRVDSEVDGQPSAGATGDDTNGSDESGVQFLTPLVAGQSAQIRVIASTNGILNTWIDLNINGNWNDAGEQVLTNIALLPGTNTLTVAVPGNVQAGNTYSRFRFGTVAGLGVGGPAADGEVEDHALTLQGAANLSISSVDGPDPLNVGGSFTVRATISNAGPSTATAILISNALPKFVNVLSTSNSAGAVSLTSTTLVCSLNSLLPGASAFVEFRAEANSPGNRVTVSSVRAAEIDTNLANNVASQTTTVLATPRSFVNADVILLPDILSGPGDPYPSPINVTGFTSSVYKVTVVLDSVTHSFPDDIDVLLVAPGGRNAMLLSDAGADFIVDGVVLTVDDNAATPFPNSGQMVTGAYSPTNHGVTADVMAAPAPPGPYGRNLATFQGINPNGVWNLYVVDDTAENTGYIGAGWTLNITAVDPIAQLELTMNDSPDPSGVGTNITYAISITNRGPAAATSVTLTNLIPAGLVYDSATTSQGNCVLVGNTVECALGNLPVQGGVNLSLRMRPQLGGRFTNTVSVFSDQYDTDLTNNTASVTTDITPEADLSVQITSTAEPALLQQPVTFTLSVSNNGPNTATSSQVTHQLPLEFQLQSITAPPGGSCTNNAGTIQCNLAPLASKARVAIQLNCRPTVVGTFTNVATVAGPILDGVASNNTASRVSTVVRASDLVVAMRDSIDPAPSTQPFSYSLFVTNRGPNGADVVLVDTLPPSANLLGVAPSQGTCSNDAGIVTCYLGSMSSNAFATVTVQISSALSGVLTNRVQVSGSNADPNPVNNSASETTVVTPNADLAVLISASRPGVWPGESFVWTIQVTNRGPDTAHSVHLTDAIPTGVIVDAITPSQGSCSNNNGTIACDLGELPLGFVATVQLSATAAGQGSQTNVVNVSASELDLIPANNSAISRVHLVGISGTFSSSTPLTIPDQGPGSVYPSVIEVTGLTGAVQRVRVRLNDLSHSFPDDLDILLVGPGGQAVKLLSDVGGRWETTNASLSLDMAAFSSLPDEDAIISGNYLPTNYEVEPDVFPAPAPAGPYATSLDTYSVTDPNGPWALYVVDDTRKDDGSLGSWSLEIETGEAIADLALTKTGVPQFLAVGSNLTYTVVVSNKGPALATGISLSESLPSSLQFLSATPSQGSCSVVPQGISCQLGSLGQGSNATITVHVRANGSGLTVSTTTVSGGQLDLVSSNNSVSTVITLEAPPLITEQPASFSGSEGTNVVFRVVASGAPPLSFQWLHNGAVIPDATNSVLELTNIIAGQVGQYRVQITNRVGGVLSAPANLIVQGAPQLVLSLADRFVPEDTNILVTFVVGDFESPASTLTVTASSSNPSLVSSSGINLSGTSSNRAVMLTPQTNQNGNTTISLTVADPDGGKSTRSFVLNVTPVNDPPRLTPLSATNTVEDTAVSIAVRLDDPDIGDQFSFTAASSNSGIVDPSGVVFVGGGNTRTMTITPQRDAVGTAQVTVTAADFEGLTSSASFVLTVTPVNDAPLLDAIAPVDLVEDAAPYTVNLTGIFAGPTNETQQLRITTRSSQLSILPAPTVSYLSPNSTGALTLTPLANVAGTATVTVTVNDGSAINGTFSRTFDVVIHSTNDPPVISTVSDQATNEDTPLDVGFTVADAETASDQLLISVTSSNAALVAETNIVLGGSGDLRVLHITPTSDQFGTTLITVNINDPQGGSSSRSFLLTVNAINDAPGLDPLANLNIEEESAEQTVALTGIVAGPSNETENVTVSANSSDTALIPDPAVSYTAGSQTGSITFTPTPNRSGSAVITVTVNDGQLQKSQTFTVNVGALNDPPEILAISAKSTPEDSALTFSFIVQDNDTPLHLVGIAATSSDEALVASSNMVVSGFSSNRTIRIIPTPDAFGVANITLTANDGGNLISSSFSFTVAPVNDAPTLDPLPHLSINQGSGQFTVNFAGVTPGPINEVSALSVDAVSSNTTLMTVMSVTYSSPSSSGSVRLRPGNGTGTAVVNITATDNQPSNNVINRAFTVYIKSTSNTNPVISNIPDQTTPEDTPRGPVAFTVGDTQTAASGLTLFAASSNPALVPLSNIVFGGSGSNRTVTITPGTNLTGTSQITVYVSDPGFGLSSDTFNFTVTPLNDPPVFSAITNRTFAEDSQNNVISFSLTDADTILDTLVLTATSSNQALIPNANLVLGGGGTNRVLFVSPLPDQTGQSSITITAVDGATNASRTFQITISPANDPPTLAAISDVVINEDASASVPLELFDLDSAPSSLVVSAISSNGGMLPTNSFSIVGAGASRTLNITPAPDAFGAGTVTVSVRDTNGASSSQTFNVTVTPINDPPAFNALADLYINQDGPLQTVALGGISSGPSNENQTLFLVVSNSNGSLIQNPTIIYTSPATTGALTFVPVPGAYGTATVTITLFDGGNSVTRSFNVIVNGAPQISDIPNQETTEDVGVPEIHFTISDPESDPTSLVLRVTSLDTNLVPNTNIVVSGTGTNRSLLITSQTNLFGTTRIQLSVQDTNGATANSSFELVVHSINDAPVISAIPDLSTNEDTSVTVSFTIGDIETAPSDLILSASSSNPTVVPTANLVFSGTDAERTLVITPATNRIGSATITITATDVGGSVQSRSFSVTFLPINDPPFLGEIADLVINEDATGVPVSLFVVDPDNLNLALTASSTNISLLPSNRMSFTGSGTNRFLILNPLVNQSGVSLITVNVTDPDQATVSRSFLLTVLSSNDLPTISPIAEINLLYNTSTNVNFIVNDVETAASNLVVTATSTNQVLLPPAGLVPTGTGTNRILSITPATNRFGRTLITVNVSDSDGGSIGRSFVLNVFRPNTPPVISSISSVATNEDNAVAINFTVTDQESPLDQLIFTVSSTNKVLFPSNSFSLTGAGNEKLLTLQPVTNGFGTSLITITAQDEDGAVSSQSFSASVLSVNDAPVINHPREYPTMLEDIPAFFPFTLQDVETAPSNLVVTVHSYSPGSIPPTNIQVGCVGSDCGFTITPATNAFGTFYLGVTVADGEHLLTNLLVLTVYPVNDPPGIGAVGVQQTFEDTVLRVSIPVVDVDSDFGNVTILATSSNQGVIPNSGIVAGGSSSKHLDITPVPNASGQALITVVAQDPEGLFATNSFVLNVNAVNDAPSMSSVPPQVLAMNSSAGPVAIAVQDIDSSVVGLSLSASSANEFLLPAGSFVFGGGSSNRTLTITPASNQYGYALATVVVSDDLGASSTRTIEVIVNQLEGPPEIALQPQSQIVPEGSTAMFRVVATGPGVLSYQWQHNGLDLAGETGSSLVISNMTSAHEGAYRVIISNAEGSVTSSEAQLLLATRILRITLNGGVPEISFNTVNGRTYRVEYSETLSSPNWIEVSTQSGTGLEMTVPDLTAGGLSRFYRIHVE